MPELLAALSGAVEEEIRGNKGLFGLESGVLERLKGGARVTPFLRHGSVRQPDSAGAAPHGLAAGGMKKWWRCPRCHISQVRSLCCICLRCVGICAFVGTFNIVVGRRLLQKCVSTLCAVRR